MSLRPVVSNVHACIVAETPPGPVRSFSSWPCRLRLPGVHQTESVQRREAAARGSRRESVSAHPVHFRYLLLLRVARAAVEGVSGQSWPVELLGDLRDDAGGFCRGISAGTRGRAGAAGAAGAERAVAGRRHVWHLRVGAHLRLCEHGGDCVRRFVVVPNAHRGGPAGERAGNGGKNDGHDFFGGGGWRDSFSGVSATARDGSARETAGRMAHGAWLACGRGAHPARFRAGSASHPLGWRAGCCGVLFGSALVPGAVSLFLGGPCVWGAAGGDYARG